MFCKFLLVATVLALADAAVLVRFVNTVPTRTTVPSTRIDYVAPADGATDRLGRLNAANTQAAHPFIDRVGFYYFAESSGSVAAATIVWTDVLGELDTEAAALNNFAWHFALPPLRPYHTPRAAGAEADAVDRLANYIIGSADNSNIHPAQHDVLEQTRIKADGFSLYLSFAPGTYRFQAYGQMSAAPAGAVIANAQAINTPLRDFANSLLTQTFEDNKVYTVIAVGTGAYSAQVPLTGNTVRLVVIEESIAPVTFGKAALRFVHAIQPEAANSIDVYLGNSFVDSGKLVSNIAFGTVSSYVEVNPGILLEFPVAVPGASPRPVGSGVRVQRDVRAGSRQTVICASHAEDTPTVFCRGIPSRVVAYVRLVNDNAGQASLVQGRFGPQRLSETPLSLWASYEVPAPEQISEQSQIIGNSVWTNHPATTEGLYPVVRNVNPGVVSGYGEVFVPIYIMDIATRHVIVPAHLERLTVGGADCCNTFTSTIDYISGAVSQAWPWFSPIFKRVHFVVKTDGYATLAGRADRRRNAFPFVDTASVGKVATSLTQVATVANDARTGVLLDEYIEPGQYYTIFSTASNVGVTLTAGADALAALTPPYAYQDSAITKFHIRIDRNIARVSTGVQSGRGIVSLVPFVSDNGVDQAFAGAFSLQQGSSTVTIPAANNARTSFPLTSGTAFAAIATPLAAAVEPATGGNNENVIPAGTYTWSYVGGGADVCMNGIPGGGSITVADGVHTDVFVLNTYGCRFGGQNNVQALKVVIQNRQSAAASGHSPWSSTTSTRSAESIPLYNSAASNAASLFFAVIVAALALFAL